MAYEALAIAIKGYDDAQLAYQLQTWMNEKAAEEANQIPVKNPSMYSDCLTRVSMLQGEVLARGSGAGASGGSLPSAEIANAIKVLKTWSIELLKQQLASMKKDVSLYTSKGATPPAGDKDLIPYIEAEIASRTANGSGAGSGAPSGGGSEPVTTATSSKKWIWWILAALTLGG
jgi:hypothetical protein